MLYDHYIFLHCWSRTRSLYHSIYQTCPWRHESNLILLYIYANVRSLPGTVNETTLYCITSIKNRNDSIQMTFHHDCFMQQTAILHRSVQCSSLQHPPAAHRAQQSSALRQLRLHAPSCYGLDPWPCMANSCGCSPLAGHRRSLPARKDTNINAPPLSDLIAASDETCVQHNPRLHRIIMTNRKVVVS